MNGHRGQAPRVLIADGHPVVIVGVWALVERALDAVRIVGTAVSGAELRRLLCAEPCELLIMDDPMLGHDGEGLRLLRDIRRMYPRLRVVVLTMAASPAILRSMLGLGVHGLVDKAVPAGELIAAVQQVAGGRSYLCGSVRRRLEASRCGSGVVALSPREAEVLGLFVQGMTVTQIARALHRSPKTVSRQKNDGMRKLGVSNHSELYLYAREHGL
ncbi:LuxR C-terminal-related transcriptional regulator [Luteimonas sp. R10]|uniref:LuxR C-terminal-related transcriptional regulator n=1 Tax=Luteimonas sp. R10 TaxID=3108176 RepID=UPI003087CC1D|nr:response regulator transcription factor [Luteimonas sp. R10]